MGREIIHTQKKEYRFAYGRRKKKRVHMTNRVYTYIYISMNIEE